MKTIDKLDKLELGKREQKKIRHAQKVKQQRKELKHHARIRDYDLRDSYR